jgi:hypothetical protein
VPASKLFDEELKITSNTHSSGFFSHRLDDLGPRKKSIYPKCLKKEKSFTGGMMSHWTTQWATAGGKKRGIRDIVAEDNQTTGLICPVSYGFLFLGSVIRLVSNKQLELVVIPKHRTHSVP